MKIVGCESVSENEVKLILGVKGEGLRIVECFEERLCRILEDRGVLANGVLDELEAAYLIARCRARVGVECGWVKAIEVLSGPDKVDLFLVYYDLRKRGRRVVRGYRRRTLIVYRGSSRPVEVLVLSEGSLVTIGDIIEWSRIASGDGKDPVVAVVDGHGNVTYYEARAVSTLV